MKNLRNLELIYLKNFEKILTTDLIYVSMAHSKEDIKRYLKVLIMFLKKYLELKKIL